ncbi:type VII secretion integral membrane protein EccD [Amycolatopsis rhizosphaerae]|uniref:Type VII secretion integral membrane protein EccD n=1 Tax=Amycolatopsis rhizosphaerae TaxID=2053003 RepID=A0A558DCA2_9PSEU|nr:type VII secretion integral membrane protein EccD [Amycolatopsis rhizosphaerae]TVT58655.1 type VII secretion integral membrane protein EccD [Amycolatopsis rhizosphaerae]
MTSAMGTTLAKVTITTPRRGLDVALPENVPVAELLPYILRHAGEDAADNGERHGGWSLRRPTGDRLDPRQTLGAQEVRDGEMLHLVPGPVEWPEIEYDDLVEAIASGARRYGRSWGRAATRRAGLAMCAVLLCVGSLASLLFEPPWPEPGLIMLAFAVVLTASGIVTARTVPDARAGAVFAGCALPYAFLGGLLPTAPAHASLFAPGAPQLLLGMVSLLVFGIIGYLGIGALSRIFVAAIGTGTLGALGALCGTGLAPDAAASLVLTAGIGLLPAYPWLGIRLGRLPLPTLPQRSADLLNDEPQPPAPLVFDGAARADEILSGLITGTAITSAFSAVFLVTHGGGARLTMLVLAAAALLLRARLFPVPRHRIPLLAAGLSISLLLARWCLGTASDNIGRALFLLALAMIALLVAASGMVYSEKNPSPWFGRIADIVDVLAIVALIPFAGYVTGFFAYVQGLMASIG